MVRLCYAKENRKEYAAKVIDKVVLSLREYFSITYLPKYIMTDLKTYLKDFVWTILGISRDKIINVKLIIK